MSDEPRVKQLTEQAQFTHQRAQAYVAYEGRCAFCGTDLISTLDRYSLGTIDHLLPKSKFPALADHPANQVLSCLKCNHLKDGHNPLAPDEDPGATIEQHIDVLLDRSRAYLRDILPRWERDWRRAKTILRGDGPADGAGRPSRH